MSRAVRCLCGGGCWLLVFALSSAAAFSLISFSLRTLIISMSGSSEEEDILALYHPYRHEPHHLGGDAKRVRHVGDGVDVLVGVRCLFYDALFRQGLDVD